jgi:nucleotide-binding universal stress UspA family protein
MRILIAIDRSEYAEIVIEHGLDQAVQRGADDLHFFTAVEADDQIDEAGRWLEAAARDGLDAFGCADRQVTLHVRRGAPLPAIVTLTRELAPDLLALGRFHAPSTSDAIEDLVDCPTLVVGIEGAVLEPQCPACRRVRRESEGQQLFCESHAGDYAPDLVTRLPLTTQLRSRLW